MERQRDYEDCERSRFCSKSSMINWELFKIQTTQPEVKNINRKAPFFFWVI